MRENETLSWIQELNLKSAEETLSESNVFSVLNIENKEVPCCKILKFLITQNWLSFKDTVLGLHDNEYPEYIELEYPCITRCNGTPRDGRIDIYIETPKYAIAIEVKLFALDQPQQLCRYHKFLSDTKKGKEVRIYYLTINKNPPSYESLSCQETQQKCEAFTYTKIGFLDEIDKWLNGVLDETQKETSVTPYVRYFIEMLNTLKGNNSMEHNAKEIANGITSENYENVIAFFASQNAVWENIRNEFFNTICNAWEITCRGTCNDYQNEIGNLSNEHIIKTLEQIDKPNIYLCYAANFYYRKGPRNNEWKYIKYKEKTISLDRMPTSHKHPVMLWFVNRNNNIGKDIINEIVSQII